MRKYKTYTIESCQLFLKQLLIWTKNTEPLAIYNSNDYDDPYKSYDLLAGCGKVSAITINDIRSFHTLDAFITANDWCLGYISYDTKNFIENLKSDNFDGLHIPAVHFFCPSLLFIVNDGVLQVGYFESLHKASEIDQIIDTILKNNTFYKPDTVKLKIAERVSYRTYENVLKKIKHHIQRGDIYEMNYCIEFYSNYSTPLNADDIYIKLNSISPSPFSCLFSADDTTLVSSSPERFLKKEGQNIISQPIKGTAPRSDDASKDKELKTQLQQSEKERSENIMIVDLARNDLARIATKNSVQVKELCGLYSFPSVHQLISTITARLRDDVSYSDIIKATFPPGSMTGAPKVKAMQLIEAYEFSRRGLYSGAVGYINPEGNFDFNVVIRSILFNNKNAYLSFHTGGAITNLSDIKNEYEECRTKAQAMINALK